MLIAPENYEPLNDSCKDWHQKTKHNEKTTNETNDGCDRVEDIQSLTDSISADGRRTYVVVTFKIGLDIPRFHHQLIEYFADCIGR